MPATSISCSKPNSSRSAAQAAWDSRGVEHDPDLAARSATEMSAAGNRARRRSANAAACRHRAVPSCFRRNWWRGGSSSAAAGCRTPALRRSAGSPDVDVHRHDAVAAAHHRIRIVVVAAAVGAAAHRDHPLRVGHLVVDLAQRRRHLVDQGAGHDHHVGLPRRRAEHHAVAVQVQARRRRASSPPRSRPGRRSSATSSRCAPSSAGCRSWW